MLKKDSQWKGKRFRRYDLNSKTPDIYGGKRHFVNQAGDYARKVWTEMGFKEMSGDIVESSFWVFDALFTPQDHPAREMQDTFFIKYESELPENKIVKSVKQSHESGFDSSKGYGYSWNEKEAFWGWQVESLRRQSSGWRNNFAGRSQRSGRRGRYSG